MRGNDEQQTAVFSYVSAEQRIAPDHPLRRIRAMTDVALRDLSPEFDQLYAGGGRPSIAPEKLLRALLLQVLYSRRSERLLMEEMNYNLLFRWFVGLEMDDGVWDVWDVWNVWNVVKVPELTPITSITSVTQLLPPPKALNTAGAHREALIRPRGAHREADRRYPLSPWTSLSLPSTSLFARWLSSSASTKGGMTRCPIAAIARRHAS